jgi:hypothetical protein
MQRLSMSGEPKGRFWFSSKIFSAHFVISAQKATSCLRIDSLAIRYFYSGAEASAKCRLIYGEP